VQVAARLRASLSRICERTSRPDPVRPTRWRGYRTRPGVGGHSTLVARCRPSARSPVGVKTVLQEGDCEESAPATRSWASARGGASPLPSQKPSRYRRVRRGKSPARRERTADRPFTRQVSSLSARQLIRYVLGQEWPRLQPWRGRAAVAASQISSELAGAGSGQHRCDDEGRVRRSPSTVAAAVPQDSRRIVRMGTTRRGD
jgi:hypothetical protein